MKGRPAEAAGGFGALATGVAYLATGNPEVVVVVGVAAGLLPGAVTWVVRNGGIREVVARLWRGYRA